MAHQSPRSRHPATWALITVLIVAPFVATLWVPFYAKTTPEVVDFPFFYWYLLLWVPIVAITSAVAYALVRTTKPPQRAAPHTGGPDGADGSSGGPSGADGPGGAAGPGQSGGSGGPGGSTGSDTPGPQATGPGMV